ncbi:hypothetical protein BC937DRAFT_91363 [Endogone sp. FLAS-F59071]|nr:hypothetical protein BC937DRAFT_91363 [Endogone sp. FLAS-F59071]|eukprot:RUS16318.1 hypothetical protein BC937DRAFT_91363 [Endogone sp. FLAS-F59071]
MSTLDVANDLGGNFTLLVAWNYVFCSNANQTNYLFNINSSQPICVCDWRVNIYGCDNTSTLLNIFFISTIISLFAGVSVFALLIYKTCRKGQTFWAPPRRIPPPIIPKRTKSGEWMINEPKLSGRPRFGIEGIIRPKPVECYLLFSGLHLLARSVAFGVIINRATQNLSHYVLLVELSQVMPWILQWIAVVLYVIGIYYHIPMHKPIRQMIIDCLGPIMIFVPPIISVVIVITSSIKRQHYNVVGADALEQINIIMWAVANCLLLLSFLAVIHRLWRVFRAYVREVELVGSRSDAIRVQRLQRGFSQMKIGTLFLPVVFNN